jgi:hypothetical protein
MWICIGCDARLTAKDAPPGIDDAGAHFICPQCSERNHLRDLGGVTSESASLDQADFAA